ncbi:hypothetical protein B0I27_10199 [Arcticibacter pallidicorallinus]|uniref:Uncharacterized protein n=2 Tax=Arcticibacter pallidicorallinus TaxID=1259464 RepID=A0A2T0UB67_9SPHI|nr:hypothetical protein B0I27_10199 [Arcticibacter pallidicorallinus]
MLIYLASLNQNNIMASIDNKGRIHGKAGSVIYRMYRGKNIMQGKPRKFEQTEGSIRASTEFGLSSSAAAAIRRAFEPAYIHRDGEAVSRTTQQVYRSLRNSLSGSIGQRDLHDANLQDLLGMDFNGASPLAEVLQISHSVFRNAEGNLEVSLGRFKPKEDVKKAAGYPDSASRYRIRLMVVALDFRQEYLEYLDIKDLDVHKTAVMEAQTITLNAKADPGCIVMLSMSLLMYDQVPHTCEYVLLNTKGFSPCAIIGAFPAEQAAPMAAKPFRLSKEAYPDRHEKIQEMGYDGNRLLKEFQNKYKPDQGLTTPSTQRQQTGCTLGKKLSFNKLTK